MVKTDLIIIGAGGFGREVASMLLKHEQYNHIGYLDEGLAKGTSVNGKEVLGPLKKINDLNYRQLAFVVAIGNSNVRIKIIEDLREFDLSYPNIIHPHVSIQNVEYVSFGQGNIICNGTILTTNIRIGNFNIINLSCTIGHDSIISDFCSIMPAVNISGGAHLKDGVFVGTGAKLIKATTLGQNSIVGAGAVINTDIESNSIYVGVPGKILKDE